MCLYRSLLRKEQEWQVIQMTKHYSVVDLSDRVLLCVGKYTTNKDRNQIYFMDHMTCFSLYHNCEYPCDWI